MVRKREEKKVKKTCHNCHKKIDLKKDKYVLLGTYNREISDDENLYFHFNCWIEYFNERVTRKAKASVQNMQDQAVKVFDNPMIKSLLVQIQGSDQALNMLKLPLSSNENLIEKISSKIQNDRKKRARKRSKRKM